MVIRRAEGEGRRNYNADVCCGPFGGGYCQIFNGEPICADRQVWSVLFGRRRADYCPPHAAAQSRLDVGPGESFDEEFQSEATA